MLRYPTPAVCLISIDGTLVWFSKERYYLKWKKREANLAGRGERFTGKLFQLRLDAALILAQFHLLWYCLWSAGHRIDKDQIRQQLHLSAS